MSDVAKLDLLEKVFAAEIEGAMRHEHGSYTIIDHLAEKLVESGDLYRVKIKLPGVNDMDAFIVGYRLTDAGRFYYCISDRCKAAGEPI